MRTGLQELFEQHDVQIFVCEDGSFDFLELEFNFCHQHGAI